MKSLLFPLPAFYALVLLLGGCEKAAPPAASTPAPGPDEKVLFQVIQENAEALNKKDVDAFMAAMHPQSPAYAPTRAAASQMFSAVDLKFTVSNLKVISSSPEVAQVSFMLKTEKNGGTGKFEDKMEEDVDTLRPDQGKWKIFGTVLLKKNTLDHRAPGTPEPTPAAPPAPESQSPPPPPAEPAPKPAPPAEKPAAPADKPAQ